jgi:prepilin signal peptidase PulO-like enzyme (type II secretory pathway)
MFYFIIFLLGLILGSYLNSWVWRMHENIRVINGRSMCPHCRRQLTWYENIPVLSYLFLWGKCRTCKKSIPRHFIFVELGTALIFVFLAWKTLYSPAVVSAVFLRDLIFSVLLIVIFVYDWLYQEILPEVVWVGALAGLGFNLYLGVSVWSMLWGVLVAGGFFWLQFVISKGKWIGGGDVRMGFMMGIWLGWPAVVVALFLSYVSGAVGGLWLIAYSKRQPTSAIPFGTYLAMGTFVVLLWGNQMIGWYMGLLR